MVNEKLAIQESYAFELEVKDTWQIPAIYKIIKDNKMEVSTGDFAKLCNEEEYENFLENISNFNIDKWERDYQEENKDLDNISWKLVIYYGDNKKIIKRGENSYPKEFDLFEELLISLTEEI